jgi:ABC-2 type transport system permease protein
MTTTDLRVRVAPRSGPPLGRLGDALAAEWIKVTTLRALYPLLVLAGGVAVGVGALLSAAAGDNPAARSAGGAPFDPVATALSAMPYAGVIVAAMAVSLVTSEYGNGMIRLTLAVTPSRWRVLGAKLLVAGVPSLLAGTAFAAASVAVGLRMLASRGVATPGLADPKVLAAIAGAGVGTCLVSLLATCVAVTVRRTAPAVALTNLIAFVPGIMYALPDWWQRNLIAYLPTGATGSLAGTVAGRSAATLPTAIAYLVVAAWALALVVTPAPCSRAATPEPLVPPQHRRRAGGRDRRRRGVSPGRLARRAPRRRTGSAIA